LKFLSDSNPFVRSNTITALGNIGDERAAAPLAQRLVELGDRGPVSEALKKLGSKAEKAVWPYVQSQDLWVRLEAVKILGAIGTKESKSVLEAACNDRHGLVVMEAKKAVAAVAARP
jgi:HEAT repeat protein